MIPTPQLARAATPFELAPEPFGSRCGVHGSALDEVGACAACAIAAAPVPMRELRAGDLLRGAGFEARVVVSGEQLLGWVLESEAEAWRAKITGFLHANPEIRRDAERVSYAQPRAEIILRD